MPKTLAEIAIEAGLVTKPGAARAGKLAEQGQLPLVVVLVRELGVDELALVAAFGKHMRVPLIDPKHIELDLDALRSIPRDVCARLHVLPIALAQDGDARVMRLAMADPTDTSAVAEIESLAHCDIDVSALPLSAIDELIERGYRQINTAVVSRPGNPGTTTFVTTRGTDYVETEVSVTAQIPLATLRQGHLVDDVETRFNALVQLLVGKGLITEAELVEALHKTET